MTESVVPHARPTSISQQVPGREYVDTHNRLCVMNLPC